MSQKVALAYLHGVGVTKGEMNLEREFERPLLDAFANRANKFGGDPNGLVAQPVNWASITQAGQKTLMNSVTRNYNLDYIWLRDFVVNYAGDAIAYQPSKSDDSIYDRIHEEVAVTLSTLVKEAGKEAPLIVAGHSLGSVIASNYFYDLQHKQIPELPQSVRDAMGVTPSSLEMGETPSPLEIGKTLAHLITMGSPLALWSLHYANFGKPIKIPLTGFDFPKPWINFFDRDDVIAYPLQPLNPSYDALVEDHEINVGGLATSWNPGSHTGYWNSGEFIDYAARALAHVWGKTNNIDIPLFD